MTCLTFTSCIYGQIKCVIYTCDYKIYRQGSQQSGIPEKPGIVMGFFFCHGNPEKPGIVMRFFYPDDYFSFCVSVFE